MVSQHLVERFNCYFKDFSKHSESKNETEEHPIALHGNLKIEVTTWRLIREILESAHLYAFGLYFADVLKC